MGVDEPMVPVDADVFMIFFGDCADSRQSRFKLEVTVSLDYVSNPLYDQYCAWNTRKRLLHLLLLLPASFRNHYIGWTEERSHIVVQ